MFLANGVATFFSQLGGTIAVPIGNTFILNALNKYIPVYADGLDAGTIVHAGPLAITQLTHSPDAIYGIRLAYSKGIYHVLIFALAVVCASIPAAAGMQWLNLKKVAEAREQARGGQPSTTQSSIHNVSGDVKESERLELGMQ